MKKYLVIGKSEQVRSSFRRDPATGKFVQFKIGRGIKVELTEEEMTFHIERQAGFGILKIAEIEVKEEAPVVVEVVPEKESPITWVDPEPEAVEEPEKPAPKKRRTSRKKKVEDDE